MIGRWVAAKYRQASVLGELVIGVAIENIGYWLGLPVFVMIMQLGAALPLFQEVWRSGQSVQEAAVTVFDPAQLQPGGIGAVLVDVLTGPAGPDLIAVAYAIWLFSNLGVILLLFKVGLESSIKEMLRVGARSLMVAMVGIIVPFVLGFLGTMLLIPDAGLSVRLFLGATLTATSVGITARVFKDLRKLQQPSAKIVLGAAVIDDILGLIILAVVSGIVSSGMVDGGGGANATSGLLYEVGRISLFSLIFLGAAIFLGDNLVRRCIPIMDALDLRNSKLLFPLILCFLMAWAASMIELAAIVGAFAAGLILNEEQFGAHPQKLTIEELVEPLEAIFAPVFFVLMGMQVNLASFVEIDTLLLAAAFTIAAIIGKVVCGLPAGKDNDRISVGLGMIPRGEVGLIFASIGKSLGVVDDSLFSALVVMVMVTTLVTPPALTWSLARWEKRKAAPTPAV
jgi:Kef-type K+ transport system membrane component KefB